MDPSRTNDTIKGKPDLGRNSNGLKKRKYSKQGCNECKRRKIKCDEAKPICWHCKRLDKVCVYSPKKVGKGKTFEDGDRLMIPQAGIPRDSTKNVLLPPPPQPQVFSTQHQAPPTLPLQQQSSGFYIYPNTLPLPNLQYNNHPSHLVNLQSRYNMMYNINNQQLQQLQQQQQQQPTDGYQHYPASLPPPTPPTGSLGSPLPLPSQPQTPLGLPLPPQLSNVHQLPPIQSQAVTPQETVTNSVATENDKIDISSQNILRDSPRSNLTKTSTKNSQIQVLPPTTATIEAASNIQIPISIPLISPPSSTPSMVHNDPRNTSENLSQPIGMNHPDIDPLSTADLLANSLNDLLESKIHEARNGSFNTGSLSPLFQMFEQGDYLIPPPADTNEQILDSTNKDSNNKDTTTAVPTAPEFITRPFPLSSFSLNDEHKRYLEFFYYDYARVIIPFQPTPDLNPAREILLSYANKNNYLLAAILACGALQSHRKTSNVEDENNYCSYLSTCLQLLSSTLSKKDKIKTNIEPMLLTVLLLTSYTAVSNLQKWRPHLRGAKDLLATYDQFNENPSLCPRNPYVMTFCRIWYMSIETLAGLSAPLGGTLQSEEEIESAVFDMSNLKMFLESMNISRRDGFNLIYGYTDSLALSLQRLIKYIRRYRKFQQTSKKHPEVIKSKRKDPEISLFSICDLTTSIQSDSKFEVIDKSGIVPKSHFMHPDNDLTPPPDFQPLSREAIQRIVLEDGSIEYMSWYDISHQSYVHAAFLIITSMICFFQKKHPMVQELVSKNLDLMVFLRSNEKVTNYSPMLLQVSMYFTGINSIYEEDRKLVVKFFELLIDLGAASAKFALNNLKKKWAKYDQRSSKEHSINIEFDEFDEEELDGDIISY